MAGRSRSDGGALWRLVRVCVVLIVILLVVPYLLVPLYRAVDPVSTLMLWRWAHGACVERTFVPIERMAPALPVTVIASEDGRFCRHSGVDWREIRERLEDVDDIGEARGVSTVTQQTAKNLFLWPGRSFVRKALEFPLAL
ncbi:MAG TPA: transglycosylase domain-containing protein, partial [Steroidobacteraceae bacterium]|nr:transglycosylase domain-containing protein [Steroidobacteraceae bacterium]